MSEDKYQAIRESLEFQIIVAEATSTSSVSVPLVYAIELLNLIDEKLKEKKQ